jgi:hypothetical protein
MLPIGFVRAVVICEHEGGGHLDYHLYVVVTERGDVMSLSGRVLYHRKVEP